ncbi:MAG: FkbM family methyltransferase [Terriglobales bacterium]
MTAARRFLAVLPEPAYDRIAAIWYPRKIARSTLADEPDLSVLPHYVGRGDVCIDAGACIGLYTKHLSRLAGDTGRVIAFEPNPRTFRYLTATAKHLALANVELRNAALSDRSGFVAIDAHKSGRLEDPYRSRVVAGAGIRCESIDDLRLSRLRFLKMDVEGHEARVLHGCAATLARCRPVVMAEANREAHAFMLESGYDAFSTHSGHLQPFTHPTTNVWYLPRN